MKFIKELLSIIYCFVVLISCNSNALTQENAEKAIRAFLTEHSFKSSNLEISQSTIQKIGNTNIYSQFHTSVKVYFNDNENHPVTLLFDFSRTPKNKWFLTSVEGVDRPIPELETWLANKKRLKIKVQ